MRKILFALFALTSCICNAGSVQKEIRYNEDASAGQLLSDIRMYVKLLAQEKTGIITPEMARGFLRYPLYRNDANGDLRVCTKYAKNNQCEIARKIKDVIPQDSQFVGFRVTPLSDTIEIYYK